MRSSRSFFLLVLLLLTTILAETPAQAAGVTGFHDLKDLAPAPVLKVQDSDNRPLLMRLFGLKRKEPVQPKIIVVPAAPTKKKKPKAPVVPKNPKNADARNILVIGDKYADGLARYLDIAFADTPTIKIENKAVADSGIIATKKFDWITTLEARLADPKPVGAVVVMLGQSDRRTLTADGTDAEFRSDAWTSVYRARLRALINAAYARNLPVYWVGLAPVADPAFNSDMAYLDEIYRQMTAEMSARYIDIWSVFADENGAYTAEGPDIGGQVRQLRLKDGVGFTKSGNRKLAFYVEQELRGTQQLAGAVASQSPVQPIQSVEDGMILSLNDPDIGPDEDLAGPTDNVGPKDGTALYDLVVLGKPLKPIAGRVDDLSVR